MRKTILITGATDGIGLETAKRLASLGHKVLVHGRNTQKLEQTIDILRNKHDIGEIDSFLADLSRLEDVEALARDVKDKHKTLDVLINNAGVFKTSKPKTSSGLDVRFMVNTIAPYLLTRRLLPLMPKDGRVVNLSSAAQAPVDVQAMRGELNLGDMEAYAQSKLALTVWSQEMGESLKDGPVVVSVNPGSLLGSKMVKEGFGVAGGDLAIGAEILVRAALSDDFADASGCYFDNDKGRFAAPHSGAQNIGTRQEIVRAIEDLLRG